MLNIFSHNNVCTINYASFGGSFLVSLGFTWRIGLTLTAGLEVDDGVEKRDLLRLLDLSCPGVEARMLVLKTGTGVEPVSGAEAEDLSAAEDF